MTVYELTQKKSTIKILRKVLYRHRWTLHIIVFMVYVCGLFAFHDMQILTRETS